MNIKDKKNKLINGISFVLKACTNWFSELGQNFNDTKIAFKNDKKKHLPNILTGIRILSIPVITAMFATGMIIPAIAISYISAITDLLDGILARKLNAKSEFGRKLDTIADKGLASTLIVVNMIQFPIFITTLLFETVIGVENLRADYDKLEAKTNQMGRVKTCLLYGASLIGVTSLIYSPLAIVAMIGLGATTYTQVKAYKEYKHNYDRQRSKIAMREFVEIKKKHEIFINKKKLSKLKAIRTELRVAQEIFHEENNNKMLDLIEEDIKEEEKQIGKVKKLTK